MRKREEEVTTVEEMKGIIYRDPNENATLEFPTCVGELDWDKVKTVEDLVALMKVIWPGRRFIHAYKKDAPAIKHLMKEEDNSEDK